MSSYIEDLVRNNEAKVVYHMTSFLGQESKRAANAAYCAVDEGRFIEFHRAIYDVQGTENSAYSQIRISWRSVNASVSRVQLLRAA